MILGWSDQVFTVISELVPGQREQAAVLRRHPGRPGQGRDGGRDPARGPDLGRTRVICRSGSPLEPADLELVSPDAARSIMVLAAGRTDADIHVIKTLLALKHRATGPPSGPTSSPPIPRPANLAAARLAGGGRRAAGRRRRHRRPPVVQSHRQSGLSIVCTDLLDFAGNEIYMRPEPAWPAALRRGAARLRPARRSACAAPTARSRSTRRWTPYRRRRPVIVIAEDDPLIRLADAAPSHRRGRDRHRGRGTTRRRSAPCCSAGTPRADRSRAARQLRRARVATRSVAAPTRRPAERSDAPTSRRLSTVRPDQPRDAGSPGPGHLPAHHRAGSDDLGTQHADARTLVTLLHLRDMAEASRPTRTRSSAR